MTGKTYFLFGYVSFNFLLGLLILGKRIFMLSLYCKAIKLLPRTINELSILVLLFRCYASLLLILQLSIARPFRNKSDDSASAEEIID